MAMHLASKVIFSAFPIRQRRRQVIGEVIESRTADDHEYISKASGNQCCMTQSHSNPIVRRGG
ncbi:MAG: hypothetical protein WAN11_22400 [Syntrophobacteraceae bacterium]